MRSIRKYLPFLLIAVGALMIYAGASRGETAAILNKAVTVCLECIGIG